jgi:putative NIF3 family GTP cyclohydrolase 1 type 2
MTTLTNLVEQLDGFFGVTEAAPDPAFSRFLPSTYEGVGRTWQDWMEPLFCTRYNGLMLRGAAEVRGVFLAAFPRGVVLDRFLAEADPGALLFVHHPIDLESGDPRGEWGHFFRPISPEHVSALRDRQLSIYSCHAPLDCHAQLSTSHSMAAALGARITDVFFPYGSGHAGVIAEVEPTSVAALSVTLQAVFDIPYLDIAGADPGAVRRVALVAGAGDRVAEMRNAEALGAQAYITGEIHSRIATEYGRARFAEVEEFARQTGMALLGVSHAASEFLVMRNEMQAWFKSRVVDPVKPLSEPHWWR